MNCKHENKVYAVITKTIGGCSEGCCDPESRSYMQKVCEDCRGVIDSHEYYEETFTHPEELFLNKTGEEK